MGYVRLEDCHTLGVYTATGRPAIIHRRMTIIIFVSITTAKST